jgi:hypothetical protein
MTKQEIIEKLQSLPDLPIVVMNDSCSATLDKVSSIEIVDANEYEDTYTHCICGDPGTHKVILIT